MTDLQFTLTLSKLYTNCLMLTACSTLLNDSQNAPSSVGDQGTVEVTQRYSAQCGVINAQLQSLTSSSNVGLQVLLCLRLPIVTICETIFYSLSTYKECCVVWSYLY